MPNKSSAILLVALLPLLAGIRFATAADVPSPVFQRPEPKQLLPSQPSLIQPVTHTQAEPGRLPSTSSDLPLTLPGPSRDSSTDKSSSGPRTLGAIVSVIGSLVVVLGLFFVLAWLMRRGLPNSARSLSNEVVQVLGRAPLAGRQQMHVVRFGNKLLLVCASPSGVDTLGEITDPLEIDRLAGLCAQTETYSATTAFKQIFGQLSREKPTASLNSDQTLRRQKSVPRLSADDRGSSLREEVADA